MPAQLGLVFEYLEKQQILVSYHDDAVTTQQWDAYVEAMRRVHQLPKLRILVWAEGPAPPPAHRAAITNLTRARDHQVALISSSLTLRFVVSTFSLVNRSIRFFTPAQLSEALAHIRCTLTERSAVESTLRRMQRGAAVQDQAAR